MKQTTAEPKNEIIIYQPNETLRLEVRVDNETIWLSQEQMIALFDRDRSVISRHIHNAFDEGEVDALSCLQKMQTNPKGRPESYYNLDVVISVGYRVKSLRGTQFRRWATKVLKERLLQIRAPQQQVEALSREMDRRSSSVSCRDLLQAALHLRVRSFERKSLTRRAILSAYRLCSRSDRFVKVGQTDLR